MTATPSKIVVIIPNWNGGSDLKACVDSVLSGTLRPYLIVVDNGSIDGSIALIEHDYPGIELIKHSTNKGYAGGVNPGFIRAIELGAEYVAPFNNDAVADIHWLERLVNCLDSNPRTGIASSKVATADGKHIDSTGDFYTSWGLAYARGRGELDAKQYDATTNIFGASGAASMYRVKMLKDIGLLDEDFFAYFEDVDLSFRAQLAGWKVVYVPLSVVYHKIGGTSKKLNGFYVYQAAKNYPWLLIRNVPSALLPHILPRFIVAHSIFLLRCFTWRQGGWALRGLVKSLSLAPKKLYERHNIQARRKVTTAYIWSIITHDLPPQASDMLKLRDNWRKIVKRFR